MECRQTPGSLIDHSSNKHSNNSNNSHILIKMRASQDLVRACFMQVVLSGAMPYSVWLLC